MLPARLLSVLLLVGLGSTAALGQKHAADGDKAVPDTVVQRVSSAVQAGDAQRLLTPAADWIEMSLFGTRTVYSRAQASYVLRDFFDQHPPEDLVLVDTTGAGTNFFLRGRLDPARGEQPLQVYVRLLRHEKKGWRLHEVRIDSEAE